MDFTTLKSAPSLGLRGTRLYFLGICYPVYRWRIAYFVPLPSLLQLQSYLVPCISARVFIIRKLQNIRCKQFLSELFSLFIEHCPNCYSVRPSITFSLTWIGGPNWCFKEHLSRALPTETICNLLQSIRSELLMRKYSAEMMLDTLEVIIKWLQVRC